jgi:CheY-like chemotaxis protein
MSKRIMLIDDEPGFTLRLRLLLESSRAYEVREVNDTRTALDAIREFQPHLILMDVMMPESDGSGVVAQMRVDEALQKIPVAYLVRSGQNSNPRKLR